MKKPGYTLLFVVMTISILTLYCFALVRGSSHTKHISVWRTRRMQYEYLAQGLLEYGIAFCLENKDRLFCKDCLAPNTIVLSAEQWGADPNFLPSGRLTIHQIDLNFCTITAQLLSGNTTICVASCKIIPLHSIESDNDYRTINSLYVAEWHCAYTAKA